MHDLESRPSSLTYCNSVLVEYFVYLYWISPPPPFKIINSERQFSSFFTLLKVYCFSLYAYYPKLKF